MRGAHSTREPEPASQRHSAEPARSVAAQCLHRARKCSCCFCRPRKVPVPEKGPLVIVYRLAQVLTASGPSWADPGHEGLTPGPSVVPPRRSSAANHRAGHAGCAAEDDSVPPLRSPGLPDASSLPPDAPAKGSVPPVLPAAAGLHTGCHSARLRLDPPDRPAGRCPPHSEAPHTAARPAGWGSF